MPYMMPGDVHVNRELSTVSVAYKQQASEFIADKVFPNIPVEKPTDFYNKMGRRAFLQTEMTKRAPRTETPGVDWNFTRDTFATETWGLHHDIEDQFRASADDNWNLDRTGTELITQQALIRREKEWYSSFFTTGVWGRDAAGVTAAPTGTQFLMWDQAGSSPIKQFRAARRRFHRRTGLRPNFVVFGADIWDVIIDHPEFIERVKYTQNTISLSEQLVANALQIDNIYVSESVEAIDGTDELVADAVPQTKYTGTGNAFLLGYRAPRPNRETPSAGYTFSWRGYLGASAFGGRVKKFRMEAIACDRIEIEMAYDYKAVAPELGEFYTNVVTAVP
jgi:hypothetical protein